MNKSLKIIAMLCAFAGIGYLVFLAGEMVLAGSTLGALMPVGAVLLIVVVYIRLRDSRD